MQWEVSSNGGTSFVVISGATSTSYSFVAISSENGYEYQAVFNTAGSVTSTAATLTVQIAPSVTANPTSQTLVAGNTATFTAAGSGVPMPSVQWEVSSNGGAMFGAISGAIWTTYSIVAISSENGYEYQAVFNSVAGSVTSTAATLTVQTVPAVTANPTSQTVVAGDTATFTAAASGVPTPSVQWEVSSNGGTTFVVISGATSTTYSFPATPSENGYEYQAVFNSVAGSVTSTAATLTVQTAPSVTANPANQTTDAGGDGNLHRGGRR